MEARLGGAEGRSRWFEFDREDDALECVRGLLTESSDWREIH